MTTNTDQQNNIIHFRIQIKMRGKKKDIKFPFDMLIDTPDGIASELKEYLELPPRAIEAII